MSRGRAARDAAPATPAPSGGAVSGVLALAAVIYGVIAALRQAWLCDDAFISFRYAENLTNGLGLVYNAGERVEGYSNFLWTLWVALGMRVGVSPERWSVAWGIACYAATIAILALEHRRARSRGAPVGPFPLAAAGAALLPDWNQFATSGLETSAFTMLAVLGWALATRDELGRRGAAAAGLVFALAAMTRPDGLGLAAIAFAFTALLRPPRLGSALAFAGLFALAFVPYAIWKVAYYGDFFPNTYYAKSASLAWYEQGWRYVSVFFHRYPLLALAAPVAAIAAVLARRGRRQGDSGLGAVALAAMLALGYTFYVLRVGGDFMFARLLIPVAPFYLVLLERGIGGLCGPRAALSSALSIVVVAALVIAPAPLEDRDEYHGIVDEHRVYPAEAVARARTEGEILRRYFDGLEIRMAYVGSQAALVYYARPAVAIESETGLTDRTIARQPLVVRGRVGHEKVASTRYLIDERRVHLVVHRFPGQILGLDDVIPLVPVAFDSVPGRIVRWDPAVMEEWARRGVVFPEFGQWLEEYAREVERLPDAYAAEAYARLVRFYFGHVSDPEREAPFKARIARIPSGG